MPELRLYLFGPPRMELGGAPATLDRRKAAALLAYLAATRRAHSRDALAALFWPDVEASRAYAYLRRALWEINHALGEGWLEAGRERVSLVEQPGFWLDVTRFEQLAGQPGADLPALEEAAALYSGPFMAGFSLPDSPAFDEWQFFQTEDLRRKYAALLDRLAERYERSGNQERAAETLRHRVALDPLHEPAHQRLMLVYARMGQRQAALRQHETLTTLLETELGARPQPATQALYQQIRQGQHEPAAAGLPAAAGVPALSALETPEPPAEPPAHLPEPMTPFVGRTQELDEIAGLLFAPGCRLLTLVGPGGIGKTRLAIATAQAQRWRFPDGVHFAYLASITEPQGIIPEVGKALQIHFKEERGEPRQQLVEYLRGRTLLLVLDNYEHLLRDGAALLPAELLSEAPGLKILVTSRIRLNVAGEQLYAVSGMRTPQGDPDRSDPAELAPFSAVQLFMQSARRSQPGFAADEPGLRAAARICQMVQGVPLAIELAAAWLTVLTPAEIESEIRRCLDFLETDLQDIPERQRSLRAVFNSTWGLLTAQEKNIFTRLTVFQGGFTRPAAEAITGATLRDLSALGAKSLLYRLESGRYGIHELLRQYGGEQLESDEAAHQDVLRRFSEHFAAWLAGQSQELKGPRQKAAFLEIEADINNIRKAWDWALDHHRFDLIDELLLGTEAYFVSHMLDQEMDRLANAVLALLEQLPKTREGEVLRAKLLVIRASSYFEWVSRSGVDYILQARQIVREWQAEAEMGIWLPRLASTFASRVSPMEGIELLRHSLPLMEASGDRWAVAQTQLYLGRVLLQVGDKAPARQAFEAAREIAGAAGDRLTFAYALSELAQIALQDQQHDEGRRILEQVQEIFEELGDQVSVAYLLEALGGNSSGEGRYAEAMEFYEKAYQRALKFSSTAMAAAMLSWYSIAAVRLGEWEKARQVRLQSLGMSEAIDDLTGMAWGKWELGDIERVLGHYDEAARLYEDSRRLFQDNRQFDLNAFYHRGLGDIAWARGDYAEALRQFHASLEISRQVYHFWGEAYAQAGLGRALLGLGQPVEARQQFSASIRNAIDSGDRGLAMIGAAGLAAAHAATGEYGRAAELAAYVVAQPAAWRETREQAAATLAQAAAHLPAGELAAAQQRAAAVRLAALLPDLPGIPSHL